ncbi:PIN domain-containing protein [Marivirga sp.]|uniref:PIN domain-containing protein n=1 Tax=Marivirga sp. TaxID=2018662 RepID=UPI003DA6F105
MTKIVVDTNIVFSAILNINSKIGQDLLTSDNIYDFYAPKYLREEILQHQEKLKARANLGSPEFMEVYEMILKKITILNHSIIEEKNYKKAINLCEDIDLNDVPFVAFSIFLKCKMWTGDKKLMNGLKLKGFKNFTTTDDLFEYRLKITRKNK